MWSRNCSSILIKALDNDTHVDVMEMQGMEDNKPRCELTINQREGGGRREKREREGSSGCSGRDRMGLAKPEIGKF